MKKKTVIIIMLVLLALSIMGCKKKDVVSDVYTIEENPTDKVDEETIATVEEPLETAIETPVEDVYQSASIPVDFDMTLLETVEPVLVTDSVITTELEVYISDFYYNYYFMSGIDPETGNVDMDAMTLFALSYIMQNQGEELRFDFPTYRVFIPVDHVIEIVQKFFHRQLDQFHTYEDLKIEFKDNVYSVIVEDAQWNDDFSLISVEKVGDFTYKVTCNVTSRETAKVTNKIVAIVDESKNGHVLINYAIEAITE